MQVHWHRVPEVTDEEREAVEARLQELAGDHGDLIDVRISAKSTRHHRHGGQEISIAALMRGTNLAAVRTRPDLRIALDEALDAFEREVRQIRDRRRDRLTAQARQYPPHLGIIDRVLREEGYGFILTDGGEQVYFHRNAVHDGLDFERLEEGQRVALNYEPGIEGPQANAVVPPPPDAPVP